MGRLGIWVDIAIIIVVSAIGMSLLARQFHIIASPFTSGTPMDMRARMATATVPVAGGGGKRDCPRREMSFQLLPTTLRINGVFMGMSSKDLVARFGPPLSRGRRSWGDEIWHYHYVTIELKTDPENSLRVHEIWGTELMRGGDVLLRLGDSRARVFQAFPGAYRSTHPHPPDSREWQDIYDFKGPNGRTIENPNALELIFISRFPYAEIRFHDASATGTCEELCFLYVVLVGERITGINEQYEYPCGKARYYIKP